MLGFRTSFRDNMGDEIFCPKLIATRYLKGEFVIDTLSTIPFEMMGDAAAVPSDSFFWSAAKIFKMLKLWRITRIPKMI